MTGLAIPARDLATATDGTIAVTNLQSARLQSWSRFWHAPDRPGLAETLVEQELLTAQFCGDLHALDRLQTLADQLARAQPEAASTILVAAQVACAAHRFVEAGAALALAITRGAPADAAGRLSLTLAQATGTDLPRVLAARRERASYPGCWEELIPLAALLTDLGEFEQAECTYRRALREYRDVSPFALAWVCFELGALWGERVPEPRAELAARWYRTAIDYLPCYVKARVHLAEILLDRGKSGEAEDVLRPAQPSGDPEVYWRLADVATASARPDEAAALMDAARAGFDALLASHPLAFADHAAEFYLAGGANPARAFELARINLASRPTLQAFEQAVEAARAAGDTHAATSMIADARRRWNHIAAFRNSPLAHSGHEGEAPRDPAAGDVDNGTPPHARP
jgi:tetratricopeptide (TPR) repeat protein